MSATHSSGRSSSAGSGRPGWAAMPVGVACARPSAAATAAGAPAVPMPTARSGRQPQVVEVEAPVEVAQAQGVGFALVHRRGERGADARADEADEESAGAGGHGAPPLVYQLVS